MTALDAVVIINHINEEILGEGESSLIAAAGQDGGEGEATSVLAIPPVVEESTLPQTGEASDAEDELVSGAVDAFFDADEHDKPLFADRRFGRLPRSADLDDLLEDIADDIDQVYGDNELDRLFKY